MVLSFSSASSSSKSESSQSQSSASILFKSIGSKFILFLSILRVLDYMIVLDLIPVDCFAICFDSLSSAFPSIEPKRANAVLFLKMAG